MSTLKVDVKRVSFLLKQGRIKDIKCEFEMFTIEYRLSIMAELNILEKIKLSEITNLPIASKLTK